MANWSDGTSGARTASSLEASIRSYADSKATRVDRGAVAASTSYAVGDVVVYRGRRVLITTAVTTGAGSEPFISSSRYVNLSPEGLYFARDFGVVGDGSTDNANALNGCIYRVWSSFGGGTIILPWGPIMTSKSIILLPNIHLVGHGAGNSTGAVGTQIKLLANSDCDVIQFANKSSSSQATILSSATGTTVSSSSVPNAFYAGLYNMSVHGSRSNQTFGVYKHGVNITTNPFNTAGAGDPEFDPTNILENVYARTCTGDGFFHSGRSDCRYINCVARYNAGWGFVSSFDTNFTGCFSGFNGFGGWYLPYSSVTIVGSKAYNNGRTAQWVSGRSYAAGDTTTDSGTMYAAKTTTSGSTAPGSDSTNWASVSSPTQLSGYGSGIYAVANELAVSGFDVQQNAGSGIHLKNTSGAAIQATVGQINVPYTGGSNDSTNTPNYAVLVLEGATGTVASIAARGLGPAGYLAKFINGTGAPSKNDITIVSDGSANGTLTGNSISLSGTSNMLRVDGAFVNPAL